MIITYKNKLCECNECGDVYRIPKDASKDLIGYYIKCCNCFNKISIDKNTIEIKEVQSKISETKEFACNYCKIIHVVYKGELYIKYKES